MKETKEITGLPVISINGGNNVGRVDGLVVNAGNKSVDYLLVSPEPWYGEARILEFSNVIGIGEFAVTTKDASNVVPAGSKQDARELLDEKVDIIGTRVMTDRGKIIGTVEEYFIDPESGKISGCRLAGKGAEAETIPDDNILTLAGNMIIVTDGEKGKPTPKPSAAPPTVTGKTDTPASAGEEKAAKEGEEDEKPVQVFEEHQRKYLLGRTATKEIKDEKGNVLIKDGEEITAELVEKVSAAGKYIELTMNSK